MIKLDPPFFLSKTNPIATMAQRDTEMLALELLESPAILAARAQAGQRFHVLGGDAVPEEAKRDFDLMLQEWTMHKLLLALNGDSNYPQVLNSTYGPPHEWFGLSVLGSRGPGTAENVDNNYVIIPVDGSAHYRLLGQRFDPPTGDCTIYLQGNLSMSMNIDSLLLPEMLISDDGKFEVTVDPEPAAGRPNHLQTTRDTRYIYIRDVRVDWRQRPSAFCIRRLDPAHAAPLRVEQKVAMGARNIVDDVGTCFSYRQMIAAHGINVMTQPAGSTFVGGQSSQWLAHGRVQLSDDEAFVLTISTGGAGYHVVVANSWWMMSLDYWNRTSSLNNTQAVPNEDGTYTFVISVQDPGIHNWIDTVGLKDVLVVVRWQLLPQMRANEPAQAWTRSRCVKLDELDKVLPAGMKRTTQLERRRQIADRQSAFNCRYLV